MSTSSPHQPYRAALPRSSGQASPTLPPFLVFPFGHAPAQLRRAPGVITVAVVSFSVVAFGQLLPWLPRALQASTGHLSDGQLWRILTYVFPHEHGWWHVTANMAVLALFGCQLERLIGTGRFLLIYLGSGAVGLSLVFAANPIDAERGLRGGASLAVFGTIAALATVHAAVDGRRSPALPWAIPTCLALLTIAGLLSSPGRGDVIALGLDGFRFGFLNHAAGMVAGVLLGIAVPRHSAIARRQLAAATTAGALICGIAVGLARWA